MDMTARAHEASWTYYNADILLNYEATSFRMQLRVVHVNLHSVVAFND